MKLWWGLFVVISIFFASFLRLFFLEIDTAYEILLLLKIVTGASLCLAMTLALVKIWQYDHYLSKEKIVLKKSRKKF
ncbi:hypothetical protein [Enterococcus timonensis]|uniref:hypothetical protein n=1 Tax=Enterococcus timonensis TaxID=1852364 RepID=UPI0008D90707|nr:hypothetical protein [Enterococcus timonensis]